MQAKVVTHSYVASFRGMFPWRSEPRTLADAAIRRAIEVTLKTTDATVIGLPPPVRLRACGAVRAWEEARKSVGAAGRTLTAQLADTAIAPLGLLQEHQQFIHQHCSLDFEDRFARTLLRHSVMSIYRQAFWSRGGALFEPTAALHRLLEQADVAHDLPIDLVRLPAPAVCIVPVPAVRDAEGGFQAMMVFEHAPPTDRAGFQRCLTFVLHGKRGEEAVVLGIPNATQSVAEAFSAALEHISFRQPVDEERTRDAEETFGIWQRHLDYAVKVLLYTGLHAEHVCEERSYSNSPREFPGLGKRKRELRMAQVEQLYDRYIVGPAVLADADSARADDSGEGRVAPHWRRGHFRLQPHGPQSALRKVLFIAPTVVRADRM
jgi:hypothetical protein